MAREAYRAGTASFKDTKNGKSDGAPWAVAWSSKLALEFEALARGPLSDSPAALAPILRGYNAISRDDYVGVSNAVKDLKAMKC